MIVLLLMFASVVGRLERSTQRENDMTNSWIGRVALHLMCILRGSDFRMHMAGVLRELQRM